MTRRNGKASEVELQDLLSELREQPLARQDWGVDDSRQIRALAASLRKAPASTKRRKTGRWLASSVGVLAAAAALALTVQYGLPRQWLGGEVSQSVAALSVVEPGDAQRADASGRKLLRARQPLGVGDEIASGDEPLRLGFSSGATAEFDPHSRLRVEADGSAEREALFLGRGAVEVEVPPRPGRGEFAITTPTARVVVHGTHFRVAVGDAEGGQGTRVSVSRGLVAVHVQGEPVVNLAAGDHWPPDSEPEEKLGEAEQPSPEKSEVESEHPSRARSKAKVRRSKKKRRKAVRSARRRVSALAEENALFTEAMQQKQRGDIDQSVRTLESFLARYPRSVLAQEAHVELFRSLAESGHTWEAARSARRYLSRYAKGYAHEEARQLVLESQ